MANNRNEWKKNDLDFCFCLCSVQVDVPANAGASESNALCMSPLPAVLKYAMDSVVGTLHSHPESAFGAVSKLLGVAENMVQSSRTLLQHCCICHEPLTR